MSRKITSKANGLIRLSKSQNGYFVPKFILVNKKDTINKAHILKKIKKIFNKNSKLIIRSSSSMEDNKDISNAGKFLSIGNISFDEKEIFEAIDKVAKKLLKKDQIIIQQYISNVDISGVLFTRDHKNNSPYYIINYDRSKKTDLITSGKSNPSLKTKIIYRENIKDKIFFKLLKVVKFIENLYQSDKLDIEFAISKNKIFIFQCRYLIIKNKINLDNEVSIALNNLKKKIHKLKSINPFLSGKTTYFSNMSDWNPAEMIGNKPNSLSISLYSELITDKIWAHQRNNYGYKNVIPNQLMLNFAGSPYIDLRADLNSFLPKNLDPNTQNKIINSCLSKIKKNPEIHDKIEFKCIETSLDFINNNKILKFGNDYKKKLFSITKNFVLENKFLNKELNKVKILEDKISNIKKSNLSEIQKIYYLIFFTKNYGTLPFAGAARLAFVGTKFLKSLKDLNVINQAELESFYHQPKSIPNLIKSDLDKLRKKKISKQKFLNKYGHLRPHSYNITSKNYSENFNIYFNIKNKVDFKRTKIIKINKNKISIIQKLINKNRLKISSSKFLEFIKNSIYAREYCKFVFTKGIDEIFNNINKLCNEIKIKKKDIQFTTINTFKKNLSSLSPEKLKDILNSEIKINKKNQMILDRLILPDIIFDQNNIYNFEQNYVKGNYITNKGVTASILNLNYGSSNKNFKDKIVIIENADPGYDYLFSFKIKGLITKYGGANSHMSIRCLELGIPAIIGVGGKNFEEINKAEKIYIDCKNQFYKILN